MEAVAEPLILVGVGLLAAALNAVAGGGTFFTFPLLIFLGIPPITANATSKFAIWIGAASSVGGYWEEVKRERRHLIGICIVTLLASIAGAALLLMTPPETFRHMVPWLMAAATALFAFGAPLVSWAARYTSQHRFLSQIAATIRYVGQTVIGLYGGFFGAGIGILMLAYCQLTGITDIHRSNAIKVVVATGIMMFSALTFVVVGDAIYWPVAIALSVGTLVGGYFGATLAKKLPQTLIKQLIILYGITVSLYFFWDIY